MRQTKAAPPRTTPDVPLLRMEEVAVRSGRSTPVVRAAIANGKLRAVRIGRRIYVPEDAAAELVDAMTRAQPMTA